jgi:hypothetical protein
LGEDDGKERGVRGVRKGRGRLWRAIRNKNDYRQLRVESQVKNFVVSPVFASYPCFRVIFG